jgi:hypothetical protein
MVDTTGSADVAGIPAKWKVAIQQKYLLIVEQERISQVCLRQAEHPPKQDRP